MAGIAILDEQHGFANAAPTSVPDPGVGGAITVPSTGNFIAVLDGLIGGRTLPAPAFLGQTCYAYAGAAAITLTVACWAPVDRNAAGVLPILASAWGTVTLAATDWAKFEAILGISGALTWSVVTNGTPS